VKIGPVDHEIALLNLKKKKEINASKIDSPSGKFAERAKKVSSRMLITNSFNSRKFKPCLVNNHLGLNDKS